MVGIGCTLCDLSHPTDLAAQIRWLPKREKILEESPENIPFGLAPDAFDHPVLIVTKGLDEKGKVVVLMVSPFRPHELPC